MKESIAILGGGNGAHAAAADLTLRGYSVRLYENEKFASNLKKVFETREIELSGAAGSGIAKLEMVTSNLEEALAGVTYILVAVPAFAHKAYADLLAPHIRDGQIIFLLPGTMGSLVFWNTFKKKNVHKDIAIAETHTLPYATRLEGPGKSLVMSRFNPLKFGVIPAQKTEETFKKLSQFFDGLEPCESIVACGLSSLNPIIHVPGCIMNAGRIEYAKGEFWFYREGVTRCVARAIDVVDKERIAILKKLGYASEVVARGIGNGIESDDVYDVINGDENFAKIKGPADIKNRYYSEDIPYGMACWALIGKMLGIPCPMMEAMVNIGNVVLEKNCWTDGNTLADFGIDGMTLPQLHSYLQTGA